MSYWASYSETGWTGWTELTQTDIQISRSQNLPFCRTHLTVTSIIRLLNG